MDSMAEIKELIQAMLQQVAIMSHHVNMLKIHNSLALVRLSLLKVSSKTAPLNTNSISSPGLPPLLTISNTHQTFNTSLSPLPAPPSSPAHTVATSSTSPSTPVSPLPGSPLPKAPAFLRPSSPPSTTMTTTPLSMTTNPLPSPPPIFELVSVPTSTMPLLTTQPFNRKPFISTLNQNPKSAPTPSLTFHQTSQSPSQLVTNSPTELISFFQTMSLMKRLGIASESVHISKLISGYNGLTANYERKLFELMLERNGQKIFEKILFVFDPGGTFTVEKRGSFFVTMENGEKLQCRGVSRKIIGYGGWAEMLRSDLVDLVEMWWHAKLSQVSLQKINLNSKGPSRMKFFLIFSTLDFVGISTYHGSPFIAPWLSIVNMAAAFIMFICIIAPLGYWKFNTSNAQKFLMISNKLLTIKGLPYDTAKVLTPQFELNEAACNNYGKLYLSPLFA